MEKKFYFKETELNVFPETYFPREDSVLLAENVSFQKNEKVLDVGTGSGLIAILAAKQGADILAVDLGKKALENAKANAKKLKLLKRIKFLKSDLFEKIPKKEKFDKIIFNPPYVPSESIRWIESDGGKNGRKILDRFLIQFPEFLKQNGKCFFLQTSLNGIGKTESILKKNKMLFEIVARKKLFFEELAVFECHKNPKNAKR